MAQMSPRQYTSSGKKLNINVIDYTKVSGTPGCLDSNSNANSNDLNSPMDVQYLAVTDGSTLQIQAD